MGLYGIYIFVGVLWIMETLQGTQLDSPKIPPIVFPPNVRSGLSTKAMCTVEKGSKPLEFRWKYNSREIENFDSATLVTTYEDVSILNIDPVSAKHNGNYACIVRNSVGEDSFTTVLVVQEPTTWVKEPDDKEVL
ncbi:Down syndrome cell adhesion molecule-like protein Dscam2 [Stegodyphus dumicola]|uniref:Down syndrome cell adhesion molecule-like protein Dscam2 n=1 Tax=Stegodyphus dumicola TaxID=202533 RepID=UPI0015B260DA|nr:Down syndrome cell adhesion molecule-like protein Dscam2 [Stegodyphus dumicola]